MDAGLLDLGVSTISLPQAVMNNNNTITQQERLFTVRPRGANTDEQGGGNRGTRASIRLLSTNNATSLARANNTLEGYGGPSLSASGGPLDQALNGNNSTSGYADFFLTDIRCSLDEKLQITEVFGDGEVSYYFGRQPVIMNLSGYIFDSVDNSWFVEWLTMYTQVMRGSQLAMNYELLKIVLPNMYVIGTMTNMTWQQNSARDTDITFSCNFLVKQLVPTAILQTGVPTSNAATLINFSSIPSFVSQSGINSLSSQFSTAQSTIQNPMSTSSDIASSITGIGSGLSSGIGGIGADATSAYYSTETTITSSGGNGATLPAGASVAGGGSSANILASISANLTGVRASLFSPIYGVLSSLAKLISNVVGTASSVFSAISSTVGNILRDITDISSLAIGLVNLVNGTIATGINALNSLDAETRMVLGSLIGTAGVIASAPMTIAQSITQLLNAGTFPATTGFLMNQQISSLSSGGSSTNKIALLNSGAPYTAQAGAFL
jgi:hypothetical protein